MRSINDAERAEFDALTSNEYDNFTLVSTEFDGEETVAIATIEYEGDGDFRLTPLYVRVTDAMFERMANPAKDLPDVNGLSR